MAMEEKKTLCWTCTVPGTGGCSWDKEFQPVEGWEAEPTRLRSDSGMYDTESYAVKACPLYQPMTRDTTIDGRASVLSDTTLERWLMAGFTDREIARRTGLAVSTVVRRRQKYLRERKEDKNA